MHSSLTNDDISYLKSLCIKKKSTNNGKFLSLLLSQSYKKLTKSEYEKFELNIKDAYQLRTRLNLFFVKDRKGFYVESNNYKITRDKKNSFFRFLIKIKDFIEKNQGFAKNNIKSIKVYDEYRNTNKKSVLKVVSSYLEKNNFSSRMILKSISEDIITKNFLMKINNLPNNTDLFIIKPSVTISNSCVCFIIFELSDKKKYLFYYDEELPYLSIDGKIDENKVNLGNYGAILNKFNKEENYEKFDSKTDFKNICSKVILLIHNILLDEKKFHTHKSEIEKELEKIRLYFPENVISYNYISLIQNFLEQSNGYLKQNENDNFVIKQLFDMEIQSKVIYLLKEKHKV